MATRTITVALDKSAAFRPDQPVGEIVVAQPDMVQLVATTDHGFYIRARRSARPNLYLRPQPPSDRGGRRPGRPRPHLAAVRPSSPPCRASTRRGQLGYGVLLSGEASTSAAADRAAEIAEHYAPKEVTSQITLKAAQQIMVEVRVLEINRTALKDMGFNLTAQNSSGLNIATGTGLISGQNPAGTFTIGGKLGTTSVDLTLQALETKGLLRTLARPNLTAMSGEEASFLAGGEFPWPPVPAGLGQVTIEFRQYGVKLKVTPTIQASGEIKLKVAPEVSQLDQAHSIQIDGFLLPSIDVSNASTTVELKDGQSFAVAGLFQQSYNNAVNQVPGLGNLPVLGALFRSASYQRQETELAIIVTPHLMTPTNNIESLPNPLADAHEPSAIDLILAGMTEKLSLTGAHAIDALEAPEHEFRKLERSSSAGGGDRTDDLRRAGLCPPPPSSRFRWRPWTRHSPSPAPRT